MMILTKEIIDAVKKAVEAAGSQEEFASKAKISQGAVNKYMNGRANYITDRVWINLEPVLRPYLPNEFKINQSRNKGGMQVAFGGDNLGSIENGSLICLRQIKGILDDDTLNDTERVKFIRHLIKGNSDLE